MNIYNFEYTGKQQEFRVPTNGQYKLECWGAEGGYRNSSVATREGKGGYACGTIHLKQGDCLYVYVGQDGNTGTANNSTFNGGGKGASNNQCGGGATDFRITQGAWDNSNGLLSRILVAGGGGSVGGTKVAGGAGGGLTGIAGSGKYGFGGEEGTQTSGGSGSQYNSSTKGLFGSGGKGIKYFGVDTISYGGAGGGGWYGGGGVEPDDDEDDDKGGGGGSGYALTSASYKPTGYIAGSNYYLTDVNLVQGNKSMSLQDGSTGIGKSGHGFARITLLKEDNITPTINGSDENLGEKNLAFSISYTVNDANADELTVIEKLNGSTINTIINPQFNKPYTLSITKEMMDNLIIGVENTIEISVTDGKATAYRRYKFIKTNVPPIINVSSVDLGVIGNRPTSITYTVNDLDNDTCTITEKINSKITKAYTAALNKENIFDFPIDEWLKTPNGTGKITIEATDTKGNTTIKDIYFTKSITKIEIITKNAIETSIAATKILVTPKWNIEGGTGEVWACNNGYDNNPTWENITTMINLNRPYLFTNKSKTASKWGIGIKFKIIKNTGYTGEISLSGFGGAYE